MTRRLFSIVLAALVLAASALPAAAQHKRRFLVLFEPGTTQQQRQRGLNRLGLKIVREFPALDMALVEVGPSDPPAKSAGVEIEADFYAQWIRCEATTLEEMQRCSFKTANIPPSRPRVFSPNPEASAEAPWGVKRVKAPLAWRRDDGGTQGEGVTVAVIDTGIDCSHPDLTCDQAAGFNALDPEKNSFDDNGHGTHVAGTIAAKWDGKGVAGVAPRAKVVAVKVLDADGGGMVSDIVRGIDWAVDHGAQVINMSLGSAQGSKALERAIKRAYAKGVTIVAAAGNEGPGEDTVGYPARYPEVIAVAATDQKDGIADFSSRGPEVDLSAPGAEIRSTVPGGGYETMSGTSMACPHVAGLAALAVAAGARGPAAVRRALLGAADHVCGIASCPSPSLQGAGIVDASRMIKRPGEPVLASLGL